MAQHDYDIANQSFPSFRSDLNSVLEAINTSNSGTSRPSSAVAGTIWLDTTSASTPTLKFYDGSDDISLATLDYTANTVNWLDSTVSVNIVSDTTPQLGGDLDVNGNSIVSVSNGNITFTPDGTGKVIIDGLSHPTADGTSGQNIITDGAGNLSFSNVIPADNTVSLAKLTATGTKDATTFLRGDNTFAEAGGGSLVKIATQTFSNVASYTDTTSITSTYNNYLIILENVLPATNNVDLEINWKNSGGSNLNKTAINRKIASCDSGSTADSLNTGGNSDLHNETTNHQIGEDMGNDATLDGGASVNIILYNANSSTSSKFYEHNTHMGHSGDCYYNHYGGGKIKSNDQVRQFYIAFNSGNITSGKYTIYGFEV